MAENPSNQEVTDFLDKLNHPMRKEIDSLRQLIHDTVPAFTENIKWNGPNYKINNHDYLTMRIQPPTKIQLVFHRGAKVQEQPDEKLIAGNYPMLTWKSNDRAVATFKDQEDITKNETILREVIQKWLEVVNE